MAITGLSKDKTTIHGVLVVVFDVGVLIFGDSGTGKTDLALELIERGHRLVADDVVEIECTDERLIGQAPERFTGLLAVSGVGIVDVRETFGSDAVQDKSRIDVCVELRVDCSSELFTQESPLHLLGIQIPKFIFSPTAGRNLRLLIETAAKTFGTQGLRTGELIASHNLAVPSVGGN